MNESTAENSASFRDVRDALASELHCGQDDIEELDGWQDIIRRLEERDLYRLLLGELVDALHDEVKYEVGQSSHVLNRIDDACRELGDAYIGYVGTWF